MAIRFLAIAGALALMLDLKGMVMLPLKKAVGQPNRITVLLASPGMIAVIALLDLGWAGQSAAQWEPRTVSRTSLFSLPAPGSSGNASRHLFHRPGMGRTRLTATSTIPTFGRAIRADSPRLIQEALKFRF